MRIVKIAAFLLLILLFLAVYQNAFWSNEDIKYRRSHSEDAYRIGNSVEMQIMKFHAEHKRLPSPKESEGFRAENEKFGNSAVYDAEKKMVVVKAWSGQKFTLFPEEVGGGLDWICQTIDFPLADLPSECLSEHGTDRTGSTRLKRK